MKTLIFPFLSLLLASSYSFAETADIKEISACISNPQIAQQIKGTEDYYRAHYANSTINTTWERIGLSLSQNPTASSGESITVAHVDMQQVNPSNPGQLLAREIRTVICFQTTQGSTVESSSLKHIN